ncbi:MAG: DAK2 domain-containing protein [Anaerolineaceae bacterium]|nr:MAG: DAK2 domain-containing protein [Anaerolineaceae bacterium]
MVQQDYPGVLPAQKKWVQCNGRQLRKLAKAGLIWLEQNHQYVNSLNVFPVPDGDTGTNMLLTMRSAVARIEDDEEIHVGTVAAQLSQGALMGARGNSGVILSQIWRGLAKGLKNKETFDVHELAESFHEAAETAYNGVMRPVEGTILTVIREGASEAADAAEKSSDLRFVMERVVERCQQALERTPDLLPVLKEAGVVDSGGQGLVYIFEGMLRYVTRQMRGLDHMAEQQSASLERQRTAQELAAPVDGQIENPYDVQFILMGENLNVMEVRHRIDAMGDSTVVVGDENAIKVHIHVKNPGEPLSYGISLGKITDVVVENMQLQMEEIINTSPATSTDLEVEQVTVNPGQIGVVAVAAGEGLANIFRSLGAAYIVEGGQTNNPSTEEIFQAIQDVPTDKIIILPNNKNIILAAEAARDLSPKQVAVVPTRTAPQGFSALLAHDPDGELEATAENMIEASQQISTGEITRATRTVTLDGVEVNEGEVICLVDGRLSASGDELDHILVQMLQRMDMDEREIISIYSGAGVSEEEAEGVVARIESLYPEVEVELLPGDQAHYSYIIGAE